MNILGHARHRSSHGAHRGGIQGEARAPVGARRSQGDPAAQQVAHVDGLQLSSGAQSGGTQAVKSPLQCLAGRGSPVVVGRLDLGCGLGPQLHVRRDPQLCPHFPSTLPGLGVLPGGLVVGSGDHAPPGSDRACDLRRRHDVRHRACTLHDGLEVPRADGRRRACSPERVVVLLPLVLPRPRLQPDVTPQSLGHVDGVHVRRPPPRRSKHSAHRLGVHECARREYVPQRPRSCCRLVGR
mmetsp:Transcript_27178/g.68001  ORF Transcript_27178/g.68001 Transcript_27178/m.68001 type:complete len:239 (-) Transcript_27178:1606-2322(-)